jgi:hypothetical protein
MNDLFAFLSCAVIFFSPAMQGAYRPEETGGVTVVKQKWFQYVYLDGGPFPDASGNRTVARQPGLMPGQIMPRSKPTYQYSVTVKNEGSRTIKAVMWEYVFLDPTTRKELGSHRFQTSGKIHPDKKSTLNGWASSPPTRIVSAAALEKNAKKPYEEHIVIRCVAFTDGSFWLDSATDLSHCDQKRNPLTKRAGR